MSLTQSRPSVQQGLTGTVIKRDNDWLRATTEAIHRQYITNPLWSNAVGRKLITVHPLGGCRMADDASNGVVNDRCQVFQGDGGGVHEGLYVCDGAVLSGAIGVNPLLAIAAVAERACAILAEQYGWQFDSSLASSKPHEKGRIAIIATDLKLRRQRARMALEQNVDGYGKFLWQQFSKVAPHSAKIAREALSFRLQFEERMSGYFNEIETTPERSKLETERRIANPFDLVHRIGQVRKNDMVGSFKVRIPDLKEFELATDHSGELSGTVTCLSLSKHPMKLTEGLFELLRSDSDRVETWEMNYRGILEVQGGPNLNFDAFKLLDEKSGSHWWTDVTTLFVEISRQHVATVAETKPRIKHS